MKIKTKKEIHYRCKKCGDEIYWNTHKKMIMCKCKASESMDVSFMYGLSATKPTAKKLKDKGKYENEYEFRPNIHHKRKESNTP